MEPQHSSTLTQCAAHRKSMECSIEMYQRSRLNFGHWQVPQYRAAYSKHLTDLSRQNVWCAWHWILASLKLWKKGDLCMVKKMKYTIISYVRTLQGAKGTNFHLLLDPKSDHWRKSVETVNPQNLSSWWHHWSPGIFYCSTSERLEIYKMIIVVL